MRGLILIAFAATGAVAQNPEIRTTSGTRAVTSDHYECKSLFGSGGTPPASNLILRTTTTEAPTTKPSTVTVAGPASTSTLLTATKLVDYIATVTSDTKVVKLNGPTTTFATATFATTECTNGAAPPPQSTVTVYSGVYTPVPGQATTLPASYPTQVVCQTTQNVLLTSFLTVLSGVVTTTTNPVTTITDQATTTVPYTFTWATQTAWRTTVTETSTTLAAASTTRIVRTSCAAPTVTTTYAAKCAPTNLVRDHDGMGLWWNYLDANATKVVARRFDDDAAACCQACVENADCSAVEVSTGGICSLYFNHDASYKPVCGSVGFTYRSLPDIWPGQGIWVQDGCGEARWLGPGE
ncbi:hypothetical protein PG997_010614 [Apiospora hydei]|uniref:Apple domain-containing protein n=1 Tax=Apiospora hydei TaxID=1337664 RepID=A0ABR1VGQ0_9PEZI